MHRTNSHSLLALAVALALSGGCLYRRAPGAWQRTMSQAERSPYGSWVWVKLYGGRQVGGELLAADAGHVYVAAADAGHAYVAAADAGHVYVAGKRYVVSLRLRRIRSITIDTYRVDPTGSILWSILGTASTVTHGFFLVFSAPVWVGTGIWASRSVANLGADRIDRPGAADVGRLRRYARYPEGLPPAMRQKPHATPPGAGEPPGRTPPGAGEPPVRTPPGAGEPPVRTPPSPPRMPPELQKMCGGPIRRWRKESDPAKETLLYRDMPALCKSLITQPAQPARPAR